MKKRTNLSKKIILITFLFALTFVLQSCKQDEKETRVEI